MSKSNRTVADALAQQICHSIGQPDDEYGITIDTPIGTKVRVTEWSARQGHDYQKEDVSRNLTLETPYTIAILHVGSWSTEVFLEELPGIAFNSVHFCYLHGEQPV